MSIYRSLHGNLFAIPWKFQKPEEFVRLRVCVCVGGGVFKKRNRQPVFPSDELEVKWNCLSNVTRWEIKPLSTIMTHEFHTRPTVLFLYARTRVERWNFLDDETHTKKTPSAVTFVVLCCVFVFGGKYDKMLKSIRSILFFHTHAANEKWQFRTHKVQATASSTKKAKKKKLKWIRKRHIIRVLCYALCLNSVSSTCIVLKWKCKKSAGL